MLAFRLLILQLAFSTLEFATAAENGIYFVINAPTSTAKPVPIPPQGYIHHSDIKMSYKIYTNRLNWTNAQEACSSEGASLAVIDTPTKLRYVKNIRPWRNWVWTGIHRESRISKWTTVNGDPISSSLPPLHYTPFTHGNCVAASGLITLTRLSVISCDATRWYVCEIPDPE